MAVAVDQQIQVPQGQEEVRIAKLEQDCHWEQEISFQGSDPGPETSCQHFWHFHYQEASGPRETLIQLRKLCDQWLRPEVCMKEQILELLVLEQLLTVLPQEIQIWVRQKHPESGCGPGGGSGDSLLCTSPQSNAKNHATASQDPWWEGLPLHPLPLPSPRGPVCTRLSRPHEGGRPRAGQQVPTMGASAGAESLGGLTHRANGAWK